MYLDNNLSMAVAADSYDKLDDRDESSKSLETLECTGSNPDLSRASPHQLTVCTMLDLEDGNYLCNFHLQ